MFGWASVEVAIGLIFVYLILSLIVTAFQEALESIIKLRGSHLAKGIKKLLGSAPAKEFFDHPLIKGLSPDNWFGNLIGNGTRNPSYIEPRTFSMTLLDLVVKSATAAPRSAADIQTGINQLPDPHLKQSLTALFDKAQGNVAKFEELLEVWFNDQMERVSGWYKRKAQFITLVAAFAITLVMNADSFLIIKTLSNNSVLRASLAAQAEETIRSRTPARTDQQKQEPANQPSVKASQKSVEMATPNPSKKEDKRSDPDGKDAKSPQQKIAGAPKASAQTKEDDGDQLKLLSEKFAQLEKSISKVQGLGLPIGINWWNNRRYTAGCLEGAMGCFKKYCPTDEDKDCVPLVEASLGWIVTALAISLGAPFWFDILNKVVSIRSAGKSPEEKKK